MQIRLKVLKYNQKAFYLFIEKLVKRRVFLQLARAMNNLYKTTRNYVTSNNNASEEFITQKGLRQGGVMSPAILYNIYGRYYVRMLETHQRGKCAFAVVITVLVRSKEESQPNLKIWNEPLRRNGMVMNLDKRSNGHRCRTAINTNTNADKWN